MFISELKYWLNVNDPYLLQRLALYKALFTATVMVYIYWIFLPANALSYIVLLIIIARFESPVFYSNQERYRYFIFFYLATTSCSLSFYLIYPHHLAFILYALAYITVLYFLIARYYPKIKNTTMMIVGISAISLNVQPPANLQEAYNLFSGQTLSYLVLLNCLLLFPNVYPFTWKRALLNYLHCLKCDLEASINDQPQLPVPQEVSHIEIILSHQRKLPKDMIAPAVRIYVNLRNIHFSLSHLYRKEENFPFWRQISLQLDHLHKQIEANKRCNLPEMAIDENNPLQVKVTAYLLKSIHAWNRLCQVQSP